MDYAKHHNATIVWLTLLLHHISTGRTIPSDFWDHSGIENATTYFVDDKPVIIIRFTNGELVRLTAEKLSAQPVNGSPVIPESE